MADSKSLFQSWQRQTYFLKCSSNSVYYWHLSYRSPRGPHPRCCFTRGQAPNPCPQSQPGESRAEFRTTDSTHSFRAAAGSLLWEASVPGVVTHQSLYKWRHVFLYLACLTFFISSRWRDFKCQRTCLAIFPHMERKCIFFISRQNVKSTYNFSAINFVWVNKGFCLGHFMVYNDQVG